MPARLIRVAAVAAVSVGALTGCQGFREHAPSAGTATIANPTSRLDPAPNTGVVRDHAPESVAIAQRLVGKTGWYDSFAIIVDTVTAAPVTTATQESSAQITIALTYQNLVSIAHKPGNDKDGNDDETRHGYLELDGSVQPVEFDSPQVAGNGTARGTAIATIPAGTRLDLNALLDRLTLVYGQADDNQTKIPFAAGAAVSSTSPAAYLSANTSATTPPFSCPTPTYGPATPAARRPRTNSGFSSPYSAAQTALPATSTREPGHSPPQPGLRCTAMNAAHGAAQRSTRTTTSATTGSCSSSTHQPKATTPCTSKAKPTTTTAPPPSPSDDGIRHIRTLRWKSNDQNLWMVLDIAPSQ